MTVAALTSAISFGAAKTQASTVKAETARLVFHVSPATSKGTLPEQVREAVKALRKANGGGRMVKLRAFVAGPGDLNQVAAIVSDAFPATTMPVVNVIRIGGLPDGAKVVMELVSESKRVENPNGLAFISGQLTTVAMEANQTTTPVAPLAEKSVANIKAALKGLQLEAGDVVRVTCFTSSLVDYAQVRKMVRGEFAGAAVNVVQIQRAPATGEVECESVARLRTKPVEAVRLVNPTNAAFAQAAVVGAPVVMFSTTLTSTGNDDAGVRAGLAKLKGVIEAGGSAMDKVFYAHGYPTSPATLQKFRDLRWEFFDRAHAPASTNLLFEGVTGPEGGVGVDVIGLPGQ